MFRFSHFSQRRSFLKLVLPIVCCWQMAYSQISYQKFPLPNQILQRDEQNEAIINVKGLITERNHSSITLRIFREETLFFENTINVSGVSPFEFSPKIPAGKYNYFIRLYLDGKEVKSANRIAVGDVFLVYGLSNALGYVGIN